MGVKAELYRAYSEREGKVKAIPFLMKLLGFDSIETGEDEEIWRTSEKGRHFKFETATGEVKAGFGGKLTGKKLGEKFNPKSEGTQAESPKSTKPASAPQSQPAAVSEAKTKWQSDLEKKRGIAMKWSPDRQAEFLNNQGFLDFDAAVEAMENGTAGAQMEKYFAIQAKNGDPTPTKKVLDPKEVWNSFQERLNEMGDWDEARKSMMREFTGMSEEEAKQTYHQMTWWFGGSWNLADTDTLDAYIDRDGACKGKLYRGLKFNEEEYQAFMKGLEPGATINMRGMNSSWTTNEEVAWNFYHGAEHEVKITCVANRTASPVDFISTKGEYEVLAHSRARWTVLGVNEGPGRTEITVVETGEFMSVEERDRLKQEHANDAAPEKAEKQVSLAQRMQEQAAYMTVEPASLEFVAQMKREHPEWF